VKTLDDVAIGEGRLDMACVVGQHAASERRKPRTAWTGNITPSGRT
jgi:hypothetical protein